MAVKKSKKKTTKKKVSKKSINKSVPVSDEHTAPTIHVRGKPRKLDDVMMIALQKLYQVDGLTDKEVAAKLGISEETIHDWKRKHSSFFRKVTDWKNIADDQIERRLRDTALGFMVTEKKPLVVSEGEGMQGVEYHDYQRYVAPSVKAQTFWLTNRKAGDWKNKREHEIKEIQGMDDSELKAKVAAIMNKSEED